MVKYFFDTNKPVAAVCHGAQLLAAAGEYGKCKAINSLNYFSYIMCAISLLTIHPVLVLSSFEKLLIR